MQELLIVLKNYVNLKYKKGLGDVSVKINLAVSDENYDEIVYIESFGHTVEVHTTE